MKEEIFGSNDSAYELVAALECLKSSFSTDFAAESATCLFCCLTVLTSKFVDLSLTRVFLETLRVQANLVHQVLCLTELKYSGMKRSSWNLMVLLRQGKEHAVIFNARINYPPSFIKFMYTLCSSCFLHSLFPFSCQNAALDRVLLACTSAASLGRIADTRSLCPQWHSQCFTGT